jgi:DNA-binding NtrC family response regulator
MSQDSGKIRVDLARHLLESAHRKLGISPGERRVLYLNLADAGPPAEMAHLTAAGWDVQLALNPAQAETLIKQGAFRAGIVRVDSAEDPSVLQDIESALSADEGIQWIALLSKTFAKQPEICHLVADHCHDYNTVPVDPARLLVILGHAYGMGILRQRPQTVSDSELVWGGMVGTSPVMQQLFRQIERFSTVDAPVLLIGETGTGKELAARAIHQHSDRSRGPFVAVNCAALPSTLIQSELFGHEKGSFTGAHKLRIGRFEAASAGTVFLDEIGDLPLDLQVNLLRVLEERALERVGSTEKIPIDARVIAATNVDLEEAVKQGRFRRDLYFRLNVLHLKVPSLRERGEDIEILARFFLARVSAEVGRRAKGFCRDALLVMNRYPWPGNVRELMNRTRRAAVMCEGRLISLADLGLDRRMRERRVLTLGAARAAAERAAVIAALENTHNNLSQAAVDLGISRTTLYRTIEKLGIGAEVGTVSPLDRSSSPSSGRDDAA